MNSVTSWLGDVRAVVIRNFIRMKRSPDVVVFALLQPIMFVVLFSQVFGGAIQVPGMDYTHFLMAGIFAQTAIFGATFSGMFMVQDKKKGLIDRFKTLPMSSSAVVFARTLSDAVLNVVTLTIMVLTGLVVGWRPEAGLSGFFAGFGLLMLFSWAFSWVLVFLGLIVKSEEAMNSATFMVLFPLTFLSNAFVPSDTMPTALRVFAEWNPVSSLVQATRKLFGNTGALPPGDSWPIQHPLAATLTGIVLLVVVFWPLAVARYKKVQ